MTSYDRSKGKDSVKKSKAKKKSTSREHVKTEVGPPTKTKKEKSMKKKHRRDSLHSADGLLSVTHNQKMYAQKTSQTLHDAKTNEAMKPTRRTRGSHPFQKRSGTRSPCTLNTLTSMFPLIFSMSRPSKAPHSCGSVASFMKNGSCYSTTTQ